MPMKSQEFFSPLGFVMYQIVISCEPSGRELVCNCNLC